MTLSGPRYPKPKVRGLWFWRWVRKELLIVCAFFLSSLKIPVISVLDQSKLIHLMFREFSMLFEDYVFATERAFPCASCLLWSLNSPLVNRVSDGSRTHFIIDHWSLVIASFPSASYRKSKFINCGIIDISATWASSLRAESYLSTDRVGHTEKKAAM